MARRKRMQGYEVLWLPGSDHAGIATQTKVEAKLKETEGKDRFDYGREEFIERVWKWKHQYGDVITNQMRAVGDSVDWSRERFTLDDGLSRAVQTIFKELYDKGLIYRANRMVNWSPVLQTAISDIEVVYSDDEGELVSIRYGSLNDDEPHVVIATTRVETMLGDVAVAVHPDDERYADMVGSSLPHPFLPDRQMVIVADDYVNPEFGTGAVKLPQHTTRTTLLWGNVTTCPCQSSWMRPAILRIPVLNSTAWSVMRRGRRSVSLLRSKGALLTASSLTCTPWGTRSAVMRRSSRGCPCSGGSRLTSWRKWQATRYAVAIPSSTRSPKSRVGSIGSMTCMIGALVVSCGGTASQFGTDLTARSCAAPDDEPPTGEGWKQDEDVLDTWFSSALWPFSTMGWPDRTPELEKFYPTSVLVTGYDILFFWVARMMMFATFADSLENSVLSDTNGGEGHARRTDGATANTDRGNRPQIPFKDVFLHGLVRDEKAEKCPSRWATVLTQWIGCATMARTLCVSLWRGANPGSDLPVGEDSAQSSRNFATKLFNATKFALMNGAQVGAGSGRIDGR